MLDNSDLSTNLRNYVDIFSGASRNDIRRSKYGILLLLFYRFFFLYSIRDDIR